MTTLNLNEQLAEIWEIRQLAIEIRQLVTVIDENRRTIEDRPNSELNEQREQLISKHLELIEVKKGLIKLYAQTL